MSLGPLARHWLTLLQDLVGRAQFLDLALQLLDPGLLFAARSAAFARVTRRLDAPAAQSVMGAAELRCNRAVGRVVARVIGPVFAIQSDAALAELGRVLRGLLLRFHNGHPLRVLLSRKPGTVQNAFIVSFNGSLRDELLNEEMFDSLEDARRKLALWRYDYNNVRPHSSLGNQTPAEARRTLEQFEGSAPGALAQNETEDYENKTRRLSL